MANKSFVFRFDDVEVREREFSLTRAGAVLPVEPKAFRVLLALLRNPEKLISKEELLNAVWGDAAVTDNSLARSVALLRRLLGDETRNPRYIETVATVGYRFVCKVEVSEDANGGLTGAERAETGKVSDPLHAVGVTGKAAPATTQGWLGRVFKRRSLWATAVMVVVLVASAIWYLRRPLPPRVTDYIQITHDNRHKIPVATDGARLYMNLDHQPYRPAQVAVSGGEVTPFQVALPNPLLRDVSPDGSSLLVSSFDSGRGSLWSVQIPGSSLRRLVDDGLVISAAWSPDGKLLAYRTTSGDIYVLRGDGAESHKLVSVPDQTLFPTRDVSWSPDGSRIRFSWGHKLWEVSSSGSGLHPLLPDWRPSEWQCCGRWTPDERYFVFLVSEPQVSNPGVVIPAAQIWALNDRHSFLRPAHPELVQLTSGPIRWGGPVPSKDGKKIFARGVIHRGELVRFDAQSRQLQPFLSGISAEFVTVSPDGKSLAYVTFPEGILWRANRDGSNPIQLTDPPIYPNLLRWSPDGRQILFTAASSSEGQMKLYTLPSEGGKPQMLLPSDHRVQFDPNWSPDGRKIVFSVTETVTTGPKWSLCILDLSNGQVTDVPKSLDRYSNPMVARWPVPRWAYSQLLQPDSLRLPRRQQWSDPQKDEAQFPTWSHDGKFIYFLRPLDDPGVYRIRPTGGEAERVVDLKGFRFTGVWRVLVGARSGRYAAAASRHGNG